MPEIAKNILILSQNKNQNVKKNLYEILNFVVNQDFYFSAVSDLDLFQIEEKKVLEQHYKVIFLYFSFF